MESRVRVGVDAGRAGAGQHEVGRAGTGQHVAAAGPIRGPGAGGVRGRWGWGSAPSRPLRRALRATYRRSRRRLRRLLRVLSGRAWLSGPALGTLLRPVGERMRRSGRRWARSVVGGGRPPGARTVRRALVDSVGDAVAVIAALLQASQGIR
ncbi:hypothetical protein [Micromonospora sp. HK10]|uniref:hypothetical protein n=1 Tax=Micromonospora sp. HK10 TaxID=1538294 RepID=UPI000628C5FA|nr:hypothetical protein [Micromonospora sp. HK10]KKJ98078.1 hypothetical protein LQ51_24620 [Micromonospora sp. HK10]